MTHDQTDASRVSPTLIDPALRVRTDRRRIRAGGRSERFLLVEVVAPTAAPDPSRRRPAVNLGFVLDRSGSMGGHDKIGLARAAVDEAIGRLEQPDRFSLVVYDDRIDVLLGSVVATPEARLRARRELAEVDARGSTNLYGGWLTGCEQVASGLVPEGVNRVLLLTDGLANQGVVDRDEITRSCVELRRRGITTSTFGVGSDYDEALLQAMADAGGGHYYYIGDTAQMRDHITSEVGEALEVVAREVVLELTLPDSVQVTGLTPFRVEQRGSRTLVHLGDMVSGQMLSAVLRLTFDYGTEGREVGAIVQVSDRDGAFGRARPGLEPAKTAWTYDTHAANDAQSRDVEVDRVVARFFAEKARQEAVRLNREGRFDEAKRALDGVRRRVAAYAGSDRDLREIVDGLREEMPAFAMPMAAADLKARHYESSRALRARMPDGKSQRRA